MVHWTAEEKAAIASVFGKVDLEHDGGDALGRLLVVYPWTQRYFSSFGSLSNETAIYGNAKVQAHGKKVLAALNNAAHHLDTIKADLRDLSYSHANTLHIDPENFRRFGEVFVIVLAGKLGSSFTPSVQAAFEKFFAVVVDALSHEYHN
ncbi:hemoglobin subunit beta-2-like [Pelobates cultripes]|uniref:Hemoglobin subunit beta-2-like n=1 Tax=Pelobates cultripes TaxID=61616 RepID=A0AAD1W648_PELCU|nr:hemoglobin subunit beta-2-like [Pelobates cultripes]